MNTKLNLIRGLRQKPDDGFIETTAMASPELVEIMESGECQLCTEFTKAGKGIFLFVPVAHIREDEFGLIGLCLSHVPLFLRTLDADRRGIVRTNLKIDRAALPTHELGQELDELGLVELRSVKCNWCDSRGRASRQADVFLRVTKELDDDPVHSGKEVYLLGLCFDDAAKHLGSGKTM